METLANLESFIRSAECGSFSAAARRLDMTPAAIGGGMELAPGVVAQRLAPLHVIAVASPAYLQGRQPPRQPHELAMLDGRSMRSAHTGRVRIWKIRNRKGVEATLEHKARMVANDPEAICPAALMGLGVAMIAVPYVERHLESGALQRLLPDWHADLGAISLYFANRKLLSAKTRAFVDHMTAAFREQNLAQRFSAEG
jgi:DNA-binding transcriptional LysR family regulator